MYSQKEKINYALKLGKLKQAILPSIFGLLGFVSQVYDLKTEAIMDEIIRSSLWVILPAVCGYLIVFLFRYFSAPIALENEQLKRNRDLSKQITDADLEKLLNGYVWGQSFTYDPQQVYPFKEYRNKLQFETARNRYDCLNLRCPANSTAVITFSFMNGHGNIDIPCAIIIKDGRDTEHKIDMRDIYEDKRFYVGKSSKLLIKFEYPDEYELYNECNFRVSLEGWEYDQG